jgi:DNA-binding NarL/FixJ family response regulator
MPVRVALADDSLLIREGIEQMLASEPEIELVASCADVDELLDAVARANDRAQLRTAILTIARGGSMMDPKMVDALVSARLRRDASPLAALTPRERDVLAEIAQGKSNTAIAESLVVTRRAVEKHINSIFLKLNLAYTDDVSKRVKAALLFLSDKEASPS